MVCIHHVDRDRANTQPPFSVRYPMCIIVYGISYRERGVRLYPAADQATALRLFAAIESLRQELVSEQLHVRIDPPDCKIHTVCIYICASTSVCCELHDQSTPDNNHPYV